MLHVASFSLLLLLLIGEGEVGFDGAHHQKFSPTGDPVSYPCIVPSRYRADHQASGQCLNIACWNGGVGSQVNMLTQFCLPLAHAKGVCS